MLYFVVVALIGMACATAFRWPVMLLAAFGLLVISFVAQIWSGIGVGSAAATSLASFAVLQVGYAIAGLVLSMRVRRIEAKKNLEV